LRPLLGAVDTDLRITMTILVIDDDPLIGSLIQALDPTWYVVSALDGLTGLDILHRYVHDGYPPELIILDINMPEFDGYDTCILIRSIAPLVPIVPFTQLRDDQSLPRYMRELHCTYPVYKGVAPDVLLQHLHTALRSSPPAITQPASAVFDRLLKKSLDAERHARDRRVSRIAITLFAPSIVEQLGITHLLEAVRDPPVFITSIIDTPETYASVAATQQILVSTTAEAQAAFSLCQHLARPLLLIAHTFHDGVSIARSISDQSLSVPLGVVLADHTITRALSPVLHALKSGCSYAEPILRPENAVGISNFVAERQVWPTLTMRLARLVALDFLGWATADICAHFQVAPLTIETYWSRVAERLGCHRELARVRIQHQFERRAIIDQLRDHIESSPRQLAR
jgi:DNA-binding NarL/FixJ family response regulator